MELDLDISKMKIKSAEMVSGILNEAEISKAVVKSLKAKRVDLNFENGKISTVYPCRLDFDLRIQGLLHTPLFPPFRQIVFPPIPLLLTPGKMIDLEIDINQTVRLNDIELKDLEVTLPSFKSVTIDSLNASGLSTQETSIRLLGGIPEQLEPSIHLLSSLEAKANLPKINAKIGETKLQQVHIEDVGVNMGMEKARLGPIPIPKIPIPDLHGTPTSTKIALNADTSFPNILGWRLEFLIEGTVQLTNLALKITNMALSGQVHEVELAGISIPLKVKDANVSGLEVRDVEMEDIHLKVEG